MKKIIVAAAISASLAAPAFAGGMNEPVMTPEVKMPAPEPTGSGWIVPVIALLMIGAAVATSE
jgi:hypothetical protein